MTYEFKTTVPELLGIKNRDSVLEAMGKLGLVPTKAVGVRKMLSDYQHLNAILMATETDRYFKLQIDRSFVCLDEITATEFLNSESLSRSIERNIYLKHKIRIIKLIAYAMMFNLSAVWLAGFFRKHPDLDIVCIQGIEDENGEQIVMKTVNVVRSLEASAIKRLYKFVYNAKIL